MRDLTSHNEKKTRDSDAFELHQNMEERTSKQRKAWSCINNGRLAERHSENTFNDDDGPSSSANRLLNLLLNEFTLTNLVTYS